MNEMPEAPLERTESVLRPSAPGWFVVNLAEAHWAGAEGTGVWCSFEGEAANAARFTEFGVNVHVLRPGERACMYHRENAQEAFLVLHGECTLIVEGAERVMRAGDFFHSPAGVRHVFACGDTQGPAAILMMGTRKAGEVLDYPVDPVAAKYRASASERTPDPKVAYRDFPRPTPQPSPWPLA